MLHGANAMLHGADQPAPAYMMAGGWRPSPSGTAARKFGANWAMPYLSLQL